MRDGRVLLGQAVAARGILHTSLRRLGAYGQLALTPASPATKRARRDGHRRHLGAIVLRRVALPIGTLAINGTHKGVCRSAQNAWSPSVQSVAILLRGAPGMAWPIKLPAPIRANPALGPVDGLRGEDRGRLAGECTMLLSRQGSFGY